MILTRVMQTRLEVFEVGSELLTGRKVGVSLGHGRWSWYRR